MPLPRFEAGKPLEDQLTATRLNALVDAINSAQMQQGAGIRITRNNGNTTISAIPDRKVNDIRPFTPTLQQDAAGFYRVSFFEGFLIEVDLSQTQSFIYHRPEGVTGYQEERTWYDIELGQAAYVVADIDEYGSVTGTPTIVIAGNDEPSVHYYPPVGESSGGNGVARYKLLELETETGRIKKFFAGQNLLHYAERVAMINLTDENEGAETYNVLKDYTVASDEVNYRTIQQLDGEGEPIIKPGGLNSIPFKRIRKNESKDQIQVSTVGDEIQIEGNGIDGDNAAVTVVDGLVTVVKALAAGSGWWGNIALNFADFGTESNFLSIDIEDGRIVSVTGTFVTGAGTQANPGSAQFNTKDTDT